MLKVRFWIVTVPVLLMFEINWINSLVIIDSNTTCVDISKFKECNCSNSSLSLFLKCNFSGVLLEGQFSGNNLTRIKCEGESLVMNGTIKVGSRNAVHLHNCAYRSEQSLRQLLDVFGSSDEREVEIVYDSDRFAEMNLLKSDLNDFQLLRKLSLDFRIANLQPEIFKDLNHLESLTLTGRYNLLPNNLLNSLSDLTELTLKNNLIEDIPQYFFINQRNLISLDISRNLLKSITNKTFQYLIALTDLDISYNQINSISANSFQKPVNLKVLTLKFNHLTTIPSTLLRGLTALAILDLSENRLRSLPGELLQNHTQLFRSDLSGNSIQVLPSTLFETNAALQYINISHNKLVSLPGDLFHSLNKLVSADLSHNQLQTLEPDTFKNSPYIVFLYLQSNNLSFPGSLYRNEYTFEELPQSPFWPMREQLRELVLRNNSIDRINPAWLEASELKELDLSYNRLSKMDNDDFNFRSNQMVVNVEHNQIRSMSLNATDATSGSEGFILFKLNHNPLNCDCGVTSFVQFLQMTGHVYRRWRFTVDSLRCVEPELNRGINVVKVKVENLLCERQEDCPEKCHCFVRSSGESVLINCDNQKLSELPVLTDISRRFKTIELHVSNNSIQDLAVKQCFGYEKVVELNASHNNLQHLSTELLSSVQILDLSNNNLSSLTQLKQHLEYSNSLWQLQLSANNWKCDCASIESLRFIQNLTDIIVDSHRMQCSNGRDYNLLTVSDVCKASIVGIISIALCLAIIAALALSFICYAYQMEIKIWLFTNNLCLGFVTEEEVDKDKLYDAFVSYSHVDEGFVAETLIPRLEDAPMNLKVCWHMRDWTPGDIITSQIVQSIENSRRTVVVLSKDFLESGWGQMEFRTAHVNSMLEKRIRVVIIIYGDLGDEDLIDADIKAYLKTNTYIRWGDPWFWRKLRYSMPHPARVKGVRWGRDNEAVEIEDGAS